MSSPVGGFFPIPLAMMIPFMATQSLVMGEAFGRAFQFGKRKISAMNNDDFNALDMETMASNMFKSYRNIIPELSQNMKDSANFQVQIFAYMMDLPRDMLAQLFGPIFKGPKEPPVSGGVVTDPRGKTTADVFKTTPKITSHDDFKPPPKVTKPSSIHFGGVQQVKPKKLTQSGRFDSLTLIQLKRLRNGVAINAQSSNPMVRASGQKDLKEIEILIALKNQRRPF